MGDFVASLTAMYSQQDADLFEQYDVALVDIAVSLEMLLKKIAKAFDVCGSSKVQKSVIHELLHQTQTDVNAEVVSLDKDGDGVISNEEWMEMRKSTSASEADETLGVRRDTNGT